MQGTNLHLSSKETELILNSQWILTKHHITQKIFNWLGEMQQLFKDEISGKDYLLPRQVNFKNGKISKGENYRLLPYLILDYPAWFEKNNILAIRSMFLWGNFFSITLHLSGIYKESLFQSLSTYNFLTEKNFSICVNKEEWEHHFEEHNYQPVGRISQQDFEEITKKPFLKIAKYIPVDQWSSASEFMLKSFAEIIEFLEINYQAGKKDL